MNVEGAVTPALGSGQASAAASRVAQLEGLLTKARGASSPAGVGSFAKALQEASDAGTPETPAAPEEAPPAPGGELEASATMASVGPYGSTPSHGSTSSYGSTSPYGNTASYGYGYASIPSSPPYGTNVGETSGSSGSHAYDALITQAASRYGIDPAILHGLIEQESGFDPNARSGAGALGLTQLMPSTAASLGVTEPLSPAQSIDGGARYLGEMLQQFGGNVSDALAAYNAGPGAVRTYGGVPPYPETEAYVSKVLANAAAYRAEG